MSTQQPPSDSSGKLPAILVAIAVLVVGIGLIAWVNRLPEQEVLATPIVASQPTQTQGTVTSPSVSVQTKQAQARKNAQDAAQARREERQAKEQRKRQEAEERRIAKKRRAVDNYCSLVSTSNTVVAKGIRSVASQCMKIRDNPALIHDTEWKFLVAASVAQMQRGSRELKAIETVPDGMEATHERVQQLASGAQTFTEELIYGLDNFDSPSIDSAMGRIVGLAELTVQVKTEVQQAREGINL